MWTTIFFALLAACCLGSLCAALYAVRIARRTMAFRPVELASFASKLRSIESLVNETSDALAALANRFKMQKVRNAVTHVNDREPEIELPLKEQLRRRAGLVAGQPAPHK